MPDRSLLDTPVGAARHNGAMSVIREADVEEGRRDFLAWRDAAKEVADNLGPEGDRLTVEPQTDRRSKAMAVRYSLHMLEIKAPGPGVEVRPPASPAGVKKPMPGTSAPWVSATICTSCCHWYDHTAAKGGCLRRTIANIK